MRRNAWRVAARLLAPLAAFALAACVQQPPGAVEHVVTMTLTPVGFDRLPGWGAEHPDQAVPAFLAGCAVLARTPDQTLGGAGEAASRGGTPLQWRQACDAAQSLPPGEAAARSFFESYFQPWAIADNGNAKGLFTATTNLRYAARAAPAAATARRCWATPMTWWWWTSANSCPT